MLKVRLPGIVPVMLLSLAMSTWAKEAPVLYIVGDSTVESRESADADQQQGWGGKIDRYFHRINVENRAVGGTSSRSFIAAGHWQKVLDVLEPGDFVLVQFGHNDGGGLGRNKAKASLKGMGNETGEVTDDQTGKTETVHTYGWYMKKYISEAKAKGATVIVCSLVPRCLGDDGKVGRSGKDDYGGWAKQAAKDEKAWFIDLNAIVADQYDKIGDVEEVRKEYFADHHTHTNRKGAELNAECVVAGLRGQRNCPLNKYLDSKGLKIRPYRE